MMTDTRLPPGFRVRVRDDVRALDGGRLLVGGSPIRVLRLSDMARGLLQHGTVTVGDAATRLLAARLLDGNVADPDLDALSPERHAHPDQITVVVPVRDRPAQLDRCLAALRPLQCIVVDDASEDPAAVARIARRHGAELLALRQNVGPAGARNAGLRAVGTPYVAFVDSDVVAPAEILVRLSRHFADGAVAVVGPLVAGVVRSARPRWFERYDAEASSLDLGRVGCSVLPGARVAWLPSACLVARVNALGAGFDDAMRVGEDVDLVWRLTEQRHVVRYDPSCVVEHDVRGTVRSWLGRKFVYGTGSAALAARHGDKGAPAVLSAPMAAAAAAVLLRRGWSAPVAAAAVVHTAAGLVRGLPDAPGRFRLSARLAVEGLGWGVRQESALLLRHWWPLTLVGVVTSRSVRRAVVSALIVDVLVGLRERPGVNPVLLVAGRRLDDLSYGAGLWFGAVRDCSLRGLAVRRLSGRGRASAVLRHARSATQKPRPQDDAETC